MPRDSRDDELLFDCFLDWQSRREREDTQAALTAALHTAHEARQGHSNVI
jgi:hypothetical protein